MRNYNSTFASAKASSKMKINGDNMEIKSIVLNARKDYWHLTPLNGAKRSFISL